jgi:hypothetical protein
MCTIQVDLKLSEGNTLTEYDLARLGMNLQNELGRLEIKSVHPVEEPAPDGVKSGVSLDWTQIIVTLASGGVITSLFAVVQNFLTRNKEVSVTIKLGDDELEIKGSGIYSEQQKKAIDLWINRHKGVLLLND